jgi:hypothetical protein
MASRTEPVVRIRCRSPEDEARCRRLLSAKALAPEVSLTWLVVRDADPDAVNEVLVAGGALGRVAARERIGQLIGWLLDRQGDLAGRARNVRSLVERVLSDAGLAQRYAPRDDESLLDSARALYQDLLTSGAGFVSWDRFRGLFCSER